MSYHNTSTYTLSLKFSNVFIVNFEHISHLVLVFLLLTSCRNSGWVHLGPRSTKCSIADVWQGPKYVLWYSVACGLSSYLPRKRTDDFGKNLSASEIRSWLLRRPSGFRCSAKRGVCNFIKKETLAQVFSCDICKIFKNNVLYRIPPVAASVNRCHLCNVQTHKT